jgi:hypothetical protein
MVRCWPTAQDPSHSEGKIRTYADRTSHRRLLAASFPVEALALHQLRLQPALLLLCGQVQPERTAARFGHCQRPATGRRGGRSRLQRDFSSPVANPSSSTTSMRDAGIFVGARCAPACLTNAMILRGPRLDKLCAIANDNLVVQVSLDGGCAEDHDAYRGKGSWQKTVEGIQMLAGAWLPRASEHHRDAGQQRASQRCLRPSIAAWAFRMRITSCARWQSAATRARASN